MTMFEVVVLAVVQGLTEFLPVSSSGHLVAARALFGWSDDAGGWFDAWLHLGTLLAVVLYYWRVWLGLNRRLAAQLALATIPAALAGYFWQDAVNSWLRGSTFTVIGFLITAALLVVIEVVYRPRAAGEARAGERPVTGLDALLIGLAQVAALVPAISRSAVTIAAGVGRGLDRQEAVKFSFLMSAPIIAGAGLLSAGELPAGAFTSGQLAAAFFVSFLAGLASIHFTIKLITRFSLWPAVVYLCLLAGLLQYFG